MGTITIHFYDGKEVKTTNNVKEFNFLRLWEMIKKASTEEQDFLIDNCICRKKDIKYIKFQK